MPSITQLICTDANGDQQLRHLISDAVTKKEVA